MFQFRKVQLIRATALQYHSANEFQFRKVQLIRFELWNGEIPRVFQFRKVQLILRYGCLNPFLFLRFNSARSN